MYNALACFVCVRSIVFCQNFDIMQWLPGNWIGGGKQFSWVSWAGTPSPLMHPALSRTHYFQAPATQATLYMG